MLGWGMAGAGEATLKPVAPVTGAPEEELPKNYRLLTYYDENGRPIAGIMVDQHVYPAKREAGRISLRFVLPPRSWKLNRPCRARSSSAFRSRASTTHAASIEELRQFDQPRRAVAMLPRLGLLLGVVPHFISSCIHRLHSERGRQDRRKRQWLNWK
jgi:hypothetical protein